MNIIDLLTTNWEYASAALVFVAWLAREAKYVKDVLRMANGVWNAVEDEGIIQKWKGSTKAGKMLDVFFDKYEERFGKKATPVAQALAMHTAAKASSKKKAVVSSSGVGDAAKNSPSSATS